MQLLAKSAAQAATIEEGDRSDSIKTATWILLGVTVAIFLARQIMKAVVFRNVMLDDLFMFAATTFAIGLSATILILAFQGLGALDPVSTTRLNILMKGYYASEFLYISSICFAKLSLLVLFYTVVAAQRAQRRVVLGLGVFVVTWSMSSMIVTAFQCQLPRPWEMMTLRCFDTRAFWVFYCIVDMTTEMVIISLSFKLVLYLKLRFSRKVAVVACFAPRSFVAAASAARLIWLYPITPNNDPEYRLWLPAILTQLHVCISICTACIPYMVPFFKSLDSSLRRGYSLKSSEFRFEERRPSVSSSLWYRRQKKAKTLDSFDSTGATSLHYERVPQASPHIPTPRPMSPLTPPQYNSRPGTAASKISFYRGLSISIPSRNSSRPRTLTISSPQTASSGALSPSCASPTNFLSMQSFLATRKAPTPPSKTHSPNPQTASSHYSSRSPSPVSPDLPSRFTLYPPQSTPNSRWSPELRHSGFTPVAIPPIRQLRPSASYSTGRNQGAHPPKFSTAPHPISPPSTTTLPTAKPQHLSVQELNSPMGAAINNYFSSAEDEVEVPVSASLAPPLSPRCLRNHQVLSPANTSRTQKPLPRSPFPDASNDMVRDELGMPRDSIIMTKISRSPGMPFIQDARCSPRLVTSTSQ
ncbi:hypothetical protein DE146DRAFT_282001 [Phaeosphaeria sp. MPI-PUGE-AT-0046c]|nr:hypothetical protein DE146DRAFT_282001 [Phaeosphaeria sp. MPI-PUGE-AT-0046c]